MVLIIVDIINPLTDFYHKQAKLASRICNWLVIKNALLCMSRSDRDLALKNLFFLMCCLNNDCSLLLNFLLVFLEELYLFKITFHYSFL